MAIDRETVQRILDTADIVEVVSDFVSLKRRGSSYLGLCPFHNERTPSFSVSKSKNICKCFSCGKGGSPVNFIMEHEQMSYQEALRYLAKKYNIEIKEREMTDAERRHENERASMLAVNDFALSHFEHNLYDTDDGRNIGMSYFTGRGLSEAAIKRFRLGYAMEHSADLLNAARQKGFSEEFLVKTGLCIRTDQGRIYDRFKGRVIFPVFSVSGKVIAFGGRTLKKDTAKYVNSPESIIYNKSNELYGLFQAKNAISRHDKCILVEGYMDVISMHQSGIEYVVASSGTSLTPGQIRMIHRFTQNVTVIYDGDAAGIKASLRGIDMLLAEGLAIKVLLLPDGDDPDSFAQKHSSSEVEEYIAGHEEDFIRFKTRILLQGAADDPIARSRAIADIVRSIAVIPDPVSSDVYIGECSRLLGIDERVVSLEVQRQRSAMAEAESKRKAQEKARESLAGIDREKPADAQVSTPEQPETPDQPEVSEIIQRSAAESAPTAGGHAAFMRPYEEMLLKYVVRYGMLDFCEEVDENGNTTVYKVIDYVMAELEADSLQFSTPVVARTFEAACQLARDTWAADSLRHYQTTDDERQKAIERGMDEIRATCSGLAEIESREKMLVEKADADAQASMRAYAASYIERVLCSHPDDGIRRLSLDLAAEKHVLSKIHTKFSKVETDEDRLQDLVPRAIYELKDAVLNCRARDVMSEMRAVDMSQPDAEERVAELMQRHQSLLALRSELAKCLGERILSVRK